MASTRITSPNQEKEGLMLNELVKYVKRDIAALSRAVGRIYNRTEMDSELRDKF